MLQDYYGQLFCPARVELVGAAVREVRVWRLRHQRKASMPTPAMAAFRRFELLSAPRRWPWPVLRRPNIVASSPRGSVFLHS